VVIENYKLIKFCNEDFCEVKVNEREESVETKSGKGCQQPLKQHNWGDPKKQRKSALRKRTFQVFMPLKY